MIRCTLFGLCCSLAGIATLGAQEPVDTVRLAPVVVTPTRSSRGLDHVSSAVTVITGDELRARGTRFVLDALRDAPGVAVAQSGTFGGVASLFLRGGNSNDVKVLVDGVPLNQPGGSFDFADLTTEEVERIEIVRGPASVLYGTDAVSGVIQIITRSGAGPARVRLGVHGGTFGSTELDAGVSGGGERGGYSLGFGRVATDGTYPFNSNYRNGAFSGRVTAAPDSLTDLAVTLRYNERLYHFPTDGGGVASDSNQFTSGSGLAFGIDAGRRLSHRLEARVALALHTTDDAFDDEPDNAADTSGFAFAANRTAFTSRRTADLRLIGHPIDHLRLAAGSAVELETERQFSETSSDFGAGPATDAARFDADRHTWAFYGQGMVDLTNGLSVDAGARLDDNSAFGTFATYRGGASLRLRATRLRASVGSAFKAPSFSENFARSPFEVGDPNLRPERSTSWDAGVEQRLGGATLSVSYFFQRFRDLIQFVSAAPGEPTYGNLAAASARGVEATLVLVPVRGLTVLGAYTFLRTRVSDAGASTSPVFAQGQALIRRPAHSGRIGVRAEPAARVSLAANVNLIGKRDDVDFGSFPAERISLPAYVLLELDGRVGLVRSSTGGSLALSARLTNLLDRRYESIVGFPGQRRMILIGVEAER
jgi:vitamin B12 transporter